MHDVVITGIGIACPLGVGKENVWSAIENRQSGVRQLDFLVNTGFPSPIGGVVPEAIYQAAQELEGHVS